MKAEDSAADFAAAFDAARAEERALAVTRARREMELAESIAEAFGAAAAPRPPGPAAVVAARDRSKLSATAAGVRVRPALGESARG
jgi:hypothetical protein